MGKTSYSDRQKANALVILDTENGNVARASQLTGIPETTIVDWDTGRRPVNQDVQQMRRDKKVDLADAIEEAVFELVYTARTNGSMQRTNQRDLWVSIGIGVDKIRLLRDQPTVIQQSVSGMTDNERAMRAVDLIMQVQQRALSAAGKPVDTVDGQAVVVSKPADSDKPSS